MRTPSLAANTSRWLLEMKTELAFRFAGDQLGSTLWREPEPLRDFATDFGCGRVIAFIENGIMQRGVFALAVFVVE
jgi:hypothetical protein